MPTTGPTIPLRHPCTARKETGLFASAPPVHFQLGHGIPQSAPLLAFSPLRCIERRDCGQGRPRRFSSSEVQGRAHDEGALAVLTGERFTGFRFVAQGHGSGRSGWAGQAAKPAHLSVGFLTAQDVGEFQEAAGPRLLSHGCSDRCGRNRGSRYCSRLPGRAPDNSKQAENSRMRAHC
jgi:hypothetical protein